MGLLENIQSPADLKKLPRQELPQLAVEIRRVIVDVVSQNGGHLASSLGAVELAIAIHYVFDTPEDKVIWDVGHQSYAHKLLTGRRQQFATLRQHGGLSGFTKRSESPFDPFTTGHSSTSISAALGMVCANRLQQKNNKVVAVIGDGSMTAGLAYEAMNQAGDLHKDLIVILNDNDMSIARNVGALSSLLSRTLSGQRLQTWRKDLGEFLKSVPKIGDNIYQWAKRSEESFKTFITPGMLFEAFNFDYFGPINGHNLAHLISILSNIKNLRDPVLLHVTTQKGKGYARAEENPVYFHGVGCFDVTTGASTAPSCPLPTFTQVFGETMVHLAEHDDRIVAVTAAMPEGTGLAAFAERFPERFFDVGIAEQHGVTFAAGMAAEGFRPVVAIYSTFLQRAYDQIIHDVCIENLPVVFAIDRGGLVGEDGPTHHGQFDLSFLRSLPNLVVMAPKDENELRRMLVTALRHDGPIAVRYPRGMAVGVPIDPNPAPIPIGKAEVLTEGDDMLIMAIGRMVPVAMAACEALKPLGIACTVVNGRFVKPLDSQCIVRLAERIPHILTLEDNALQGGFGSAVLELLNDHGVSPLNVQRLGLPDRFVEHGSPAILYAEYGLDVAGVVRAARQLMARVQPRPPVTVVARGN
ncbi:1-deoxy-D-xylulose-5-phosphate synthase [Desulfatitalea alkaliphila]|uniref:1-deoxy-D-xylulose-5-phosphate synthase n=1 Tax=Desulfatitalea alkaliphila TaxID=2929485 RepID=A0AA41R7N6_9BACT|nr:1-deoxy-D-xylulose-5-phosphate synthase [Desulfatitalea alkaliphila]MCJ8502496.1 1-deoxy-D-xylulose-5-phosphate synthase [Desulfatitalea alkaliphila]